MPVVWSQTLPFNSTTCKLNLSDASNAHTNTNLVRIQTLQQAQQSTVAFTVIRLGSDFPKKQSGVPPQKSELNLVHFTYS